MRTAALFALLIPTWLAGQPAQHTVRGLVVDAGSAFPLVRTRVVLTRHADTLGTAEADTAGAFELPVQSADTVVAHFQRLGYVADSIPFVPGELPLRVAMNRVLTLTALPAVTVQAAATSFDRRAQRKAGGRFITHEEIERARPTTTSDLLRTIPGTMLHDSVGVMQLISQRAGRRKQPTRAEIEAYRNAPLGTPAVTPPPDEVSSAKSDVTSCAMRVGVDGVLMPVGFSINDIRPPDIYGIEIYSGAATMPIEFSTVQRDSPCGMVMIWTKVGVARRG